MGNGPMLWILPFLSQFIWQIEWIDNKIGFFWKISAPAIKFELRLRQFFHFFLSSLFGGSRFWAL
jgi:hypothetical protein